MNADQLFALYDRVAEAPDAVGRLRRFVLNLAVRGRLVEQDPADEPASELLRRISVQKARLLRAGEIRKPRVVAPLDEDAFPFSLPTGWSWTQIAQLGVISPRNKAPDDHQTSFVPMSLIAAEYGVGHQHETRLWGDIRKGYTHFAEGDVGLAKITPCFENGKSTVFRNLTGGIGSGTTELHVVRPLFVMADYIVLFLKSSHFIETGISKMTGTAGQKRVPTEYFTISPFPLPPLAEQHRIVAKVDELMALCDQLEEARAAREDTRDRLTQASYARLSAPDTDAPTLRSHARFSVDALPTLTARADQVKQLRQTILTLAVRGKLVEQNPTEEPALELLQQARRNLEDRARSARRVRWKATAPIGPEEICGEMPPGWVPARVNDTGLYVNGLAFKPTDWKQSGTPIIRIQNLTDPSKGYNFAEGDFPDEVLVRTGDLLVSWSATLEAFRWERGEGILNQHIFRVVPDNSLTTRDFLLVLLRKAIREMAESDHAHGLVMTHINRGPFLNHVVLIPPLAEQHRIVAKFDELMALCERMEAGLTVADGTRNRLLESLLHGALTFAACEAGTAKGF